MNLSFAEFFAGVCPFCIGFSHFVYHSPCGMFPFKGNPQHLCPCRLTRGIWLIRGQRLFRPLVFVSVFLFPSGGPPVLESFDAGFSQGEVPRFPSESEGLGDSGDLAQERGHSMLVELQAIPVPPPVFLDLYDSLDFDDEPRIFAESSGEVRHVLPVRPWPPASVLAADTQLDSASSASRSVTSLSLDSLVPAVDTAPGSLVPAEYVVPEPDLHLATALERNLAFEDAYCPTDEEKRCLDSQLSELTAWHQGSGPVNVKLTVTVSQSPFADNRSRSVMCSWPEEEGRRPRWLLRPLLRRLPGCPPCTLL